MCDARRVITIHLYVSYSGIFFIAGKGGRGMEGDGWESESRECERVAWAAWVPQMTPTEPIVRTNQIAVLSMWLCGIPC